ncbi:MAG: YbaB/EbfC family nucleoid-associated protein [Candidatus Hydrogenedentota bacterium]|nr:MAG: YbaB/EbfC family nucleoid-associated protein [Candidatus Hydrogenedentota bacterium]
MGLGDMKDMFSQMRNMQKQMKQIQKQLASMRFEAETGGGLVKAIVDGEANVVDIIIDPDILDKESAKALSKLVKKAVQQAQKEAKAAVAQQAQQLAGGLGL